MFNQEMQNAQESAEAETPAKLKRKCFSIFVLCTFATHGPLIPQTNESERPMRLKNAKILDCLRRRIVPGTGIYSSAEPLYESCNNNTRERREALKSRQRENLSVLGAERPTSFNIS